MKSTHIKQLRGGEFRIYGLYTFNHDDIQCYFYVGMTERSIQERVEEHRCGTYRRNEDLYKYLRQLEQEGISWTWSELRHCTGELYWKDCERWEVIRLLRLGHDLRNMRYGNAARRIELDREVNDVNICNAADVAKARVAAIRVKIFDRARRKQRLQRKYLATTLVKTGIPSVSECELLGKALKRRLIAEGFQSVQKGVTFKDLVLITWGSRRLTALAKSLPPLIEKTIK